MNARLSHLIEIQSGRRIDHASQDADDAWSIGGEHIQNGEFALSRNPRRLPLEFYEQQAKGKIQVGDTLMVKDGATIGKSMFVGSLPKPSMMVNEHVFVLRPKNIYPPFLGYLIQSPHAHDALWASVMSAAQPGVGRSFAKNIRVLIDDFEAQQRIVSYLDQEVGRVDLLLKSKKKFVANLKKKITDFADLLVTGRSDPNREMREVDIPWLSGIPADWQVRKAKFLFKEMSREPLEDDEVITAFRDGQVCLRSRRRSEGYTFAELEVGYQHICAGDLVIHSMDAFAGAIGVSEDDGKATGEYAVCTPISGNVNCHYYAYLLRCMARRNYIFVLCPSVRERAPRFRFIRFSSVQLPLPTREEQDAIVSTINEKNAQLRSLVNVAQKSIERLSEYRAALIAATVSGEIKVGDYPRDVSFSDNVLRNERVAT